MQVESWWIHLLLLLLTFQILFELSLRLVEHRPLNLLFCLRCFFSMNLSSNPHEFIEDFIVWTVPIFFKLQFYIFPKNWHNLLIMFLLNPLPEIQNLILLNNFTLNIGHGVLDDRGCLREANSFRVLRLVKDLRHRFISLDLLDWRPVSLELCLQLFYFIFNNYLQRQGLHIWRQSLLSMCHELRNAG